MRNPITLVFGLLLSLSLAALGGVVLHQEAGALPASTDPASVARLAADGNGASLGLSSMAKAEALEFCESALRSASSLAMMYLDESQRNAVAPYCLRLSGAITDRAPTHSYAWAVGALAAMRASDWVEFNRRLALSRATGASEGWIAAVRARLALQALEHLDDDAKQASREDIAIMALNAAGAAELAELYWQRAEYAAYLEPILETLPGTSQQRFVDALERGR